MAKRKPNRKRGGKKSRRQPKKPPVAPRKKRGSKPARGKKPPAAPRKKRGTKPQRTATGRIKSLDEYVTKRFAKRPKRKRSQRTYRPTKKAPFRANTYHESYQVSLSTLQQTMESFPRRLRVPLSFQLVVTYTGTEGNTHTRATRSVGVEDSELLLDMMRSMLREYNTAKELRSVDDVQLEVWGKIQPGWGPK